MLPDYLIGQPSYENITEVHSFRSPIGQVEIFLEVLREISDRAQILERLRDEYTMIVSSFSQMGVNYRIALSDTELADTELLNVCAQALGSRFMSFNLEFDQAPIAYIRDLYTVLKGLLLLNEGVATPHTRQPEGARVIASPFGEGGRILYGADIALVPTRLVLEGHSRSVTPRDTRPIERAGYRVGQLPVFLSKDFSRAGVKPGSFFNDHIDRVYGSFVDPNDRLHLIVDPLIQTITWLGRDQPVPWMSTSVTKTLDLVRAVCERLGIILHIPTKISVPYALNFYQLKDKRILVTGGDDEIADILEEEMGPRMVHTTRLPIKYFPTWCRAGIRCTVNEAPTPIMRRLET